MPDELEKLKKLDKKIKTQEKDFRDKIKDQKKEFAEIIDEQKKYMMEFFEKFESLLKQQEKDFRDKISSQEKDFSTIMQGQRSYVNKLEENVELSVKKIIKNIDNHKKITKDLINELKEQLIQDKNVLNTKIEELQSQQDVLKISYTVNEAKLVEKVKEVIKKEVKEAVKEQEREILMKVWIDELKEIISDFEKLKTMKPDEFKLQLNEISSCIQMFKKKLF
ncbi:MAG: hypothetical protein BAJALOKI1v1_220014 [Promethearchaeota archaeon]|nr:MAG: hypothetical protein BAJALOKI1v1_220014 [Candidatus Lokiarchaeota archaeon]